jgi:hypothetical protein
MGRTGVGLFEDVPEAQREALRAHRSEGSLSALRHSKPWREGWAYGGKWLIVRPAKQLTVPHPSQAVAASEAEGGPAKSGFVAHHLDELGLTSTGIERNPLTSRGRRYEPDEKKVPRNRRQLEAPAETCVMRGTDH